jgi:hypothetical protein
MSKPSRQRRRFTIKVDRSLPGDEGAARDRLRSGAMSLVTDLALPVNIDIQLTRAPTSMVARYTVVLDDKPWRSAGATVASSLDEVARSVLADLFERRAEIRTGDFVSGMNQPTAWAGWSEAERAELVRRAVTRGHRLTRLQPQRPQTNTLAEALPPIDALTVAVTIPANAQGTGGEDHATLSQSCDRARTTVRAERGVLVPPVLVSYDDGLPAATFQIQLNDLRLPISSNASDDDVLVTIEPDLLAEHGVTGEPFFDVLTRRRWARVNKVFVESQSGTALRWLSEQGATVMTSADYIEFSLRTAILPAAAAFLPLEAVEHLLIQVASDFPRTVESIGRLFGTPHLTDVLQTWVEVGGSVSDLLSVLLCLLRTTDVDGRSRDEVSLRPPPPLYGEPLTGSEESVAFLRRYLSTVAV